LEMKPISYGEAAQLTGMDRRTFLMRLAESDLTIINLRVTRYWRKAVPHQVFDDPAALAALCRRYDIRRLSLFGSTLRGTDRPDSDVDLLVEFEPGRKPGLLGMAKIQAELTALAGGRPVDLRTAQDLSRYFRDEVVRTAEAQYATG
jgi:uncharacterized protein